jgi:hypothetical protein
VRPGFFPGLFLVSSLFLVFAPSAFPQESPYIVAYDHYLEEPGNLEVEYFSTFGTQRGGNDFHSFWVEFEYGATAWWTTELYLDGQTTFHDSTLFTGFRWENRFRPLKHEHFINPILYVEYENKSGADKILKEVEGLDAESDFLVPNAEARKEHVHEIEFKLILSSTVRGWNFTENTIASKNLSNNPWEFGYALGAALQLLPAKPQRRSGNVWGSRRPLQLRSAEHLALPRTGRGVEPAFRLDAALIAGLWAQRQQSQVSASLGHLT